MALGNQSAGMALHTQHSAIPAHRTRWVKIENFDQEKVFRFQPLCEWSSSRIIYQFWVPHARKLRIGLFDHRTTKWCFWPACDLNLDSVLLRCDHGSNSQNCDLETLRTTPMVPKVTFQVFLPLLGAPRSKIDKIWRSNRKFREIIPVDKCSFWVTICPTLRKWTQGPSIFWNLPLNANGDFAGLGKKWTIMNIFMFNT